MSRYRNPHNKLCMNKDSMQDPSTGAWSSAYQTFAPYWQPFIRPNGWTSRKLWRYRNYNKLHGERKYSNNYPIKPFRLLDLPGEVRNRIFRCHLQVGSIELAPKTASEGSDNSFAAKINTQHYARSIHPLLRVLRVNRKIHVETSSIFYGENEFRFSSMHGHDMLFAFCRTIGKRNTASLRKITEHVPWQGYYEPDTRDRPAHTNCASWNKFSSLIFNMGLHQKYGAEHFSNFKIMQSLARGDGGIQVYKLVIPDLFVLCQAQDFATDHVDRSLLSWLRKKNDLQMIVVKLTSEGGFTTTADDVQRQIELREIMCQEAEANGWVVVESIYDSRGYYEVNSAAEEENIEAEDATITEQ